MTTRQQDCAYSCFGEVSQLRTSKSIRTQNFDNVAQTLAVILLFPVSENKPPPYLSFTSGSILMPSPSACDSTSAYHISCKSNYRRPSYDVLASFQDGGHRIGNLFPVSTLVSVEVNNVKICLHTKFCQRSSIRGRYITISSF